MRSKLVLIEVTVRVPVDLQNDDDAKSWAIGYTSKLRIDKHIINVEATEVTDEPDLCDYDEYGDCPTHTLGSHVN